MITDLSIILGNQLCKPNLIKEITNHPIFMCESDDLCTHFKYHKLKIIFFLTAMREYADELKSENISCHYHKLKENENQLYLDVLEQFCTKNKVQRLHMLEVEDHFFDNSIIDFCENHSIKRIVHKSPLFLTTQEEFKEYLDSSKKPFMKTFYEQQRKKLDVLMENGKPKGGQWSFDEENRKKTPKKIEFPNIPTGTQSTHLENVKSLVKTKFNNHIGEMKNIWFPTKRSEVLNWCDNFITVRFNKFGDYEDAIDPRSDFLFHSVLSPFINAGLITPTELLEKIKKVENKIPINSYEGFVRQVIGWREFMRGIYHNYDDIQQEKNFFNHNRKLTKHWYEGTTGIAPLDDAIKQVMNLGYTHHINRLMVIGNVMLLAQIHPQEVYKWFMECFIDSSDWVMGPNVFGMSQFSDGGIFATKPYFSGSNYIRKMSHYPKAEWCPTMDALYWRFIADHQEFFSQNYRMKFMVSKINSFTEEKISEIFKLSDSFIKKVTK